MNISTSHLSLCAFSAFSLPIYANAGGNDFEANVNYNLRNEALVSGPLAFQGRTITGVVLDTYGDPVIGANVIIRGTTQGSITDIDGKYTIEDVPNNAVLQFSYIGYITKDVPVGNLSNIDVVLQEDSQALEEVVVVGYGTMRKSDVTGSIGIAKGDDLMKTQTFSALEGLRGKVSGVNIFSNSSQPGAYANRVVIRGMSTINASSNPLYVVDGVAMEDFSLVNPNDIESI